MKTIEVKIYQFSELNDKAKERAREWWRRCNDGDTYWSESVIEEAVTQGNLMGIEFKERQIPLMNGSSRGEPCIFWSGFSSQGDGACFEGVWRASGVQADKVAEGWGDAPETTEIKRIASEFEAIAKEWPSASFSVTHSGHYSHKYCTSFEVTMDEDSDMFVPNNAELPLIEAARDFMEWIYRQLEKEYWHQTSDEAVDETIEANNYEFTEDGEIH